MNCLCRTLNRLSVYLYHSPTRPDLHADASGLSLLEVVLSIAIVSISVGALVTISNASITGSDNARNRTVADQLVREGIEAARVYRDNNTYAAMQTSIIGGGASSGTKWYPVSGNTLDLSATPVGTGSTLADLTCTSIGTDPNYQVSNNTSYRRAVAFQYSNTNEMTIKSLVCYRYKGSTSQNSTATTVLSGWR